MTADLTREVEHIARLARLELTEDEKIEMAGLLSSVLDTARKIQEIDTTGVEPTAHVIDLEAAFREDVVKPSLYLNRVLQNAPRRNKSYFYVPRIKSLE